jgi:predicted ATPase
VKLKNLLDQLCEKGFLSVHGDRIHLFSSASQKSSMTIYKFDNTLTRNVIYSVNPPQKRIQMHRKIAQKIEALYSDDLEAVFNLLSYHYREAQEKEKALKYIEHSVKSYMFQGFHEKIVEGLKHAIAIGRQSKVFSPTKHQLIVLIIHSLSLFDCRLFPIFVHRTCL